MNRSNKRELPWNVIVSESSPSPSQYIVEIKVKYRDNKLKEKMGHVTDLYFTYKFKKYWFKSGIKSANIYRTTTSGKHTQQFSHHMKYVFESAEESALFAHGIELAIDKLIMEKILEDKQDGR